MFAGIIFPVTWAFIFSGHLAAPAAEFSALQWHAHEMFFGFGFAVLGGFLLTATKNWVHIRGYHGAYLIFLATAWLFERAGMSFGGGFTIALFYVSNNLFLGSILAMLLWTLIAHRKTDTFKDNLFFIIILPLFLLSKFLILHPEYFRVGTSMAMGLFRMAFLLMLERTVTQFMKSNFQVQILRHPVLDIAIKVTGLLAVFEALLPVDISAWLLLSLSLLLAVRFIFWKPWLAFGRIDLGIMYVGYLAIVFQLALEFCSRLLPLPLVGSVAVHVFTMGAMGLIIPAMMVRICKGHTGRKVAFDDLDKLVLWIMLGAFVFRVIATQLFPAQYNLWIFTAAFCWLAGFSILGWRYIALLLQPRIDGKEH